MPRLLLACLLGCASAAIAAAQPQPAARIRVVILTGQSDLPYHDWRASTNFLRQALERTGRFDVKVIEECRGLSRETLAPADVLVLNYNGPRWGTSTEAAIEDFVRYGKGLVSFHGVTYGEFYGQVFHDRWTAGPDNGWVEYPRLTGARWDPAKIGHGARHVFPVQWTKPEHPIAAGLEPTFLANDELYHKLELMPETKVLATAYSDPKTGGTGRDEPILWAAPYGRGRTFHLTLGHDFSALAQPGFLTAFTRGLEWAATGAVAPSPAAPRNPRVRVLLVTGGHGYPTDLYSLFEGWNDITWRHATTQKEAFSAKMLENIDTIVFHDLGESIGEAEQANLRAFVEAGKGVVSIHHAIVDYTSWPWWWQQVIGGKYFVNAMEGHPASQYKEGLPLVATPVKSMANHPVMRGVPPLPLPDDEAYRGMWHADGIRVLMEIDHPLNDRPAVYLSPNAAYRAIYIQLGHSASTMHHPGYRTLVHNAILWSAGKAN